MKTRRAVHWNGHAAGTVQTGVCIEAATRVWVPKEIANLARTILPFITWRACGMPLRGTSDLGVEEHEQMFANLKLVVALCRRERSVEPLDCDHCAGPSEVSCSHASISQDG